MSYTPGKVRMLLCEYQRLVLTHRLPRRTDKLGVMSPRPSEAAWAGTARLKADLDAALKSLPLERAFLTFMYLSVGNTNWNGGRTWMAWREKVGAWWGLSAGDVAGQVDGAIEAITAMLNGDSLTENGEG